jgi:hypothetical protein
MTSLEETIRSVLVRTAPLPASAGREWADVLSRSAASTRTVRARRLVYSVALAAVVAIVLAATPLGAVIARGFGDFSGWLSGSAGSPVTGKEKSAFTNASRRSWILFPKTASLRRLIVTTKGGVRYELFGFRTGDSFCLQIVASRAATARYTGCVPLSALQAKRAPALPIFVDAPVSDRETHGRHVDFIKRAGVTFGIVSDGVAGISARTQSHQLKGIVGSDSFLIINSRSAAGARVRSIEASDSEGDVAGIPLAHFSSPQNFFRDMNKPLPFGPHRVERIIRNPTIGWIVRREPRGKPVPSGQFDSLWPGSGLASFERLIKPDPKGLIQVLVSIRNIRHGRKDKTSLCVSLVVTRGLFGSCGFLDNPFPRIFGRRLPFWIMSGGGPGGDQYGIATGLSADGVARMALFLANGERIPVPIRDNVYVVQFPFAACPAVLAAYDGEGRAVGFQRLPGP